MGAAIGVQGHPHSRRHDLSGRPLGRESLLYLFQLPEEGLGFALYSWVNSQGAAGYGAWVYGGNEDGSSIFEFRDGIEMGEADFDKWEVGDMCLSLSVDSPVAQVQFQSDRFEIDAEFIPSHKAFLYSDHDRGCPPFFADDRLEQSGRFRGRLKVNGRSIELDVTGHHDHSWGVRDWQAIQHYKWFEATTDSTAVHVLDIAGLGDRWIVGYLVKDGELSPLEEIDWNVAYDDNRVQQEVILTVRDEMGRTARAEAKTFTTFEFPASETAVLVDCSMAATVDGDSGGALSDWLWPTDYLTYMRTSGA